MTSTTVIQLDHVDKQFNGVPVWEQISFTVRRGEIIGLFGPSGVGKTTLLRLIAGLDQPDAGRITVAEESRLSYIFQESRLLPWRTALGNVTAVARAAHIPNPQVAASYWLDHVELSAFKKHYPAQLSGGMQQRVSLARALVSLPDILLLDEPLSSLDDSCKGRLLDLLESVTRSNGTTVIYVTHAMAELQRLADRVLAFTPPTGLKQIEISLSNSN